VDDSELHPQDEGFKRHRDSSQSNADQAAPRLPEPLTTDSPTSDVTVVKSTETGNMTSAGANELSPSVVTDPSSTRAPLLHRVGEELLAWIKTFASAAIYATLIVTFGFQVARVEGKSMEPTLQDQDRLIVNKAVYQFFGDPQPGDIVMLYYPRDPDKSFVKRIVAKEGDTVRIEEGQVFVNEVPLPDTFVPPEFRSRENHGPEVVQESYYFVMGDHRNNSSDSRHWGQVPKKYVIGKVQLRWWPLSEATLF
jgi:signal peptidase I